MTAKMTGSCACKSVQFEVSGAFERTGKCHCSDCQKFTGGGPNYWGMVRTDQLEVTRGDPSSFSKQGDSGGLVHRYFCQACGTPLWSGLENRPIFIVKLGAFDTAPDVQIGSARYETSAPPWHANQPD